MRSKIVFLSLIALAYAMTCREVTAQNLGDVPPGGFRSQEGDARFSPEAGAKPLNNLVFELLNVESPGSKAHTFRTPREGWIYVRVSSGDTPKATTIRLDNQPVPLKIYHGHLETMRYVNAGEHKIAINEAESLQRLEVRAIGELYYSTYGHNPHIQETGVYTWEYLREHCLDHYNSMIGQSTRTPDGKSPQEAEIREWTAEGKRWYTREEVPYGVDTADAAYDHWANSLGMQHPLMSGIWADEFGVGEKCGKKTVDMYPLWIEAIRRLHANPNHAGRAFYAYGPARLLPEERFAEMVPFLEALKKADYRYGPEWYIPEGHSRPGRIIAKTDDLLAELSPGWEQSSRASFETACPGSATNRVLVVSTFSEPGWESCDLFPNYNYNAFLDAQMQFIATDPAFFGIRGLQGYLSGYCGEEQTRLFAKLIRHYAIEGNTTRLLNDSYVLNHLQNTDFADGDTGWTLSPAVAGNEPSIGIKTVPGLGTLQGKYHAPEGTGDTALWTRRSTEKPNVVSQQIRNLTPGRLYSLRFLTADFRELEAGRSAQRKHAVATSIENSERIDAKCFQAVVQSGFWYSHAGFNASNPYWLNYHQLVFRANGETAELRLSDWATESSADGPDGEELLWNFIQVQPYFE